MKGQWQTMVCWTAIQQTESWLWKPVDSEWPTGWWEHPEESRTEKERGGCAALKQEITRGTKVRDGLQKRLCSVEEQKAEVESNRERLKQQISSLKEVIVCKYTRVHYLLHPDLESQRRQAELEKRQWRYCKWERYAQQGMLCLKYHHTAQLNTVID